MRRIDADSQFGQQRFNFLIASFVQLHDLVCRDAFLFRHFGNLVLVLLRFLFQLDPFLAQSLQLAFLLRSFFAELS